MSQRFGMTTAQSAQEDGASPGAQCRSAEGAVSMLPPPVYHYAPGMWPAMYQNWGYYGPMLAAHDGSFHSGKRKRQNISDACTSCRRSKVKCDEEKPCRRCVKHGRAAACASWREVPARLSPLLFSQLAGHVQAARHAPRPWRACGCSRANVACASHLQRGCTQVHTIDPLPNICPCVYLPTASFGTHAVSASLAMCRCAHLPVSQAEAVECLTSLPAAPTLCRPLSSCLFLFPRLLSRAPLPGHAGCSQGLAAEQDGRPKQATTRGSSQVSRPDGIRCHLIFSCPRAPLPLPLPLPHARTRASSPPHPLSVHIEHVSLTPLV